MSKYKKLAQNSIIFAVANIGGNLLSFLLVRLYTEVLSTEQYGTIDLVVTTSSIIIPIITLAMVEAVFRFGMGEEDKKSVFSNGIIIALIGNILLVTICFIVSGWFKPFRYLPWLLGLVLTTSINAICVQFVRGIGKVKIFAFSGIVKTVSLIICNIFFLLFVKLQVEGYMLSLILSEVVTFIFLFFSARLYDYLKLKINRELAKKMVIYSLPLVPSTLSWWVMNASDKYMILGYIGVAANGVYTVAHKIPTIINICNSLFMQAWQISAIEETDSKTKDEFHTSVFSLLSMVLFIISSIVLTMLKPVMTVLVASDYGAVWKYSPFLVIAMVFSAFSGFAGTTYNAVKKTTGSLKTTIAGAVINIVLNYVLIKQCGINGAACATMVSLFVMWIYRVIDTRKYVVVKYRWIKMTLSIAILLLQTYYIVCDKELSFYVLAILSVAQIALYGKDIIQYTRLLITKIKQKTLTK